MFCKNCGKEVADGTKFCPNCGAQIGAAAQTAEPKTAEPKTETYTGTVNGVTGGPTKRNIGVCILLSIVTCGIYGIIWLVQMVDELNTAAGETNATSGIVVFLLSLSPATSTAGTGSTRRASWSTAQAAHAAARRIRIAAFCI